MKFSNGCWLNKIGVETFSPQEIYNTEIEKNLLTIYTPCSKIYNRGCTLGGPVITYKITSPMKNVIRVRAYHYMGQQEKSPSFEIYEDDDTNVLIDENKDKVSFKSGNLRMEYDKNTN